jgi:hypothetical protein
MFLKPAKWPFAKKKKKSKYTPTTKSYEFARRSDHSRYRIELSIK